MYNYCINIIIAKQSPAGGQMRRGWRSSLGRVGSVVLQDNLAGVLVVVAHRFAFGGDRVGWRASNWCRWRRGRGAMAPTRSLVRWPELGAVASLDGSEPCHAGRFVARSMEVLVVGRSAALVCRIPAKYRMCSVAEWPPSVLSTKYTPCRPTAELHQRTDNRFRYITVGKGGPRVSSRWGI
jgi:hypothetical protein